MAGKHGEWAGEKQIRFGGTPDEDGGWRAGHKPMWSARTCPRFGTGRHVCQWESGDMSPHSKKNKSAAPVPPGREDSEGPENLDRMNRMDRIVDWGSTGISSCKSCKSCLAPARRRPGQGF